MRMMKPFERSRFECDDDKQLLSQESSERSRISVEESSQGDRRWLEDEESGLARRQRETRYMTRLRMSVIGLVVAILWAAWLICGGAWLSDSLHNFSRLIPYISRTGLPPVLIHFKTNPHKGEVIKCDTPFRLVDDEEAAHVVIWPNPTVDLDGFDGQEARRKRPWQLNAFWSLENGQYYPSLEQAREKLATGHPKAFDLEMTYKTTSDVPVPYAYPFIDLFKPALPFGARRHDKIAAAFISNCQPMNNRTAILDELIRLLPDQIDSFGGCRNNANVEKVSQELGLNNEDDKDHSSWARHWDEKMRIIQRYKFTIAFENADEEDYVTEKYYQALSAGSPPIHLGQSVSQFEKFKPSSNGAINVADYKDIRELAEKLQELAGDRDRYMELIAWKNRPLEGRLKEIVEWGKVHEICRVAQFVRKQWINPHAWNHNSYQGLYRRLQDMIKIGVDS